MTVIPGGARKLHSPVSVGSESVSAIYDDAGSDTVFVCAHGAGGNMADKSMSATAKAFVDAGVSIVRFNFLYKEKKSGRPDAMPKLIDTFSAVVARVRDDLKPKKLVIGGRSMGGRAASMMAAEGFDANGLLLLAYPLHPAGQPEKLRVAHLPSISMPVLAFSGTRDSLCSRSLMEDALKTVKTTWDMRWVESADHSFHVLKSSGKTDAQVMQEIAAASRAWVDTL